MSLRAQVCEMFDLVCGTSTGGLLALALGVLRVPARQCLRLYHDLAATVFATTKKAGLGLDGAVRGYDTAALEHALQDFFGDARLDGTPSSSPSTDSHGTAGTDKPTPRVFVVANRVDLSAPATFLFRNYEPAPPRAHGVGVHVHAHVDGTSCAALWEAARATSAAPTYFAPFRDGSGRVFLDGGLRSNNPAFLALAEAGGVDNVRALLSIGTGCWPTVRVPYRLHDFLAHHQAPPKAEKRLGGLSSLMISGLFSSVVQGVGTASALHDMVSSVISIATDTEDAHHTMRTSLPARVSYARLNPKLPAEVPMDTADGPLLKQTEHLAREYARGEVAVRRADWGGASLAGFLALTLPSDNGHAAL